MSRVNFSPKLISVPARLFRTREYTILEINILKILLLCLQILKTFDHNAMFTNLQIIKTIL